MEDVAVGLGFSVVDPRFAARRGIEFTNAYQEDLQRGLHTDASDWSDFHQPGDDSDAQPVRNVIDVNTEIPDTNVGFRMLLRMGWTRGRGLGSNEDGIKEPIRVGIDAGVRLGLGKQVEDDHFTNAELVERRRMESEIQANEDEERRRRREAQVEKDAAIQEELTEIKKTFYCEVCHKQYEKAMEFEEHLSSYDHHHRKRLVEMRQMEQARTKDERARKEAKAASKEMARLQAQIARAHAAAGTTPPAAAGAAASSTATGQTQPPLPPCAPPPLPAQQHDPAPPPPPSYYIQEPWGAPPPPPPPQVSEVGLTMPCQPCHAWAPPPPPPPAQPTQAGWAQQPAAPQQPVPSNSSEQPGMTMTTQATGLSFGLGRGRGAAGRAGVARPTAGPPPALGNQGLGASQPGPGSRGCARGPRGRGRGAVTALAGFGSDSDEDTGVGA